MTALPVPRPRNGSQAVFEIARLTDPTFSEARSRPSKLHLREWDGLLNFATPKFNQAVTDLKALCGTHTQLFRYGQFYVTRRTMDDLLGQITADLSANVRFAIAPDQLKNTLEFFKSKFKVAVPEIDLPSILNMLDLIEFNGDMAGIRAMFSPTKADEAHARADINDVWANTHISAAPLFSGSAASLGKARAAFKLEKDRCYLVLRSFAAKLLKKRGVKPLLPTVTLSELAVAGAVPKLTAAGTPASPGVAEILGRHTLAYAQPAVLSAAATKMRAALDAGGFVHCGVLSGAMHEHSVFPNPEHHILVFAHDTVDGQDAFLFWDPDAAHSNIAGTGWGDGFGVLFSRNGRLCTGVDDADQADIERTKGVKNEGDHLRDTLRHSYQVYSLLTLPVLVRMKLHVKVLSPPARASVDEMLDRAVGFFAMNGLELIEMSRETLDTPGTDLDRFQMLFVGGHPSGEATSDLPISTPRCARPVTSASPRRHPKWSLPLSNRWSRRSGAVPSTRWSSLASLSRPSSRPSGRWRMRLPASLDCCLQSRQAI